MAVFLYTNELFAKKKRWNTVRKLYCISDIIAGKACASFIPYFIALGKGPQARHSSASACPCASFCSCLLPKCCSAFFPGVLFPPPFPYRSNALQPSNCPGPLVLTLQNKWAFKTSLPGLQFASQGPGIAGKQRAVFAKRILKQLSFTSAVQECWARQNNEPSVHSSLLPLSVSSGLKSELPKNGRVPLHLRPPCLHPEKNSFLAYFFSFCS